MQALARAAAQHQLLALPVLVDLVGPGFDGTEDGDQSIGQAVAVDQLAGQGLLAVVVARQVQQRPWLVANNCSSGTPQVVGGLEGKVPGSP